MSLYRKAAKQFSAGIAMVVHGGVNVHVLGTKVDKFKLCMGITRIPKLFLPMLILPTYSAQYTLNYVTKTIRNS